MIQDHLKILDDTIIALRSKDDKLSCLDLKSMYMFEFELIVTLEIVRYELLTTGKITNDTADAITFRFAFGVFEYYHSDFPDVYKKFDDFRAILYNYNDAVESYSLPGKVGYGRSWQKYLRRKITALFKSK